MAHTDYQILGSRIDVAVGKIQEDHLSLPETMIRLLGSRLANVMADSACMNIPSLRLGRKRLVAANTLSTIQWG